uniref:Uncharacterized protein n=1 Tax=Phlebotomus papatasi TaxID=29031 RepID=A0A1B0DIP3_PHLPP
MDSPNATVPVPDPLSRLPVPRQDPDFDTEDAVMIRAILDSIAIDVSEIEAATVEDEEITAVKRALHSGDWSADILKPYQIFRNELSSVGDVLVRSTKIVIPAKLRERMLALAHEGHPGECVMKRRLRDRGSFYEQIEGMPMGNCLSPVIADIVIDRVIGTAILAATIPPKSFTNILMICSSSPTRTMSHFFWMHLTMYMRRSSLHVSQRKKENCLILTPLSREGRMALSSRTGTRKIWLLFGF